MILILIFSYYTSHKYSVDLLMCSFYVLKAYGSEIEVKEMEFIKHERNVFSVHWIKILSFPICSYRFIVCVCVRVFTA